MTVLIVQVVLASLADMAFSLALIAGAALLLGAMVSLSVFAYRSIKGEGMKDPREVAPEKTDDDGGVSEGEADDEWDYY